MILKDPKKNVIVMKGKIKQLQESLDPEEDMFTRPKSAEEWVSLNSTESPAGHPASENRVFPNNQHFPLRKERNHHFKWNWITINFIWWWF